MTWTRRAVQLVDVELKVHSAPLLLAVRVVNVPGPQPARHLQTKQNRGGELYVTVTDVTSAYGVVRFT